MLSNAEAEFISGCFGGISIMNKVTAIAAVLGAACLAGCANDGSLLSAGGLTTASVSEPVAEAKQPKVDAQCVALLAQIDALRKEGTSERIEKVSTGKSSTAQVKRASLAKMVELDKANAEYQARCSTLTPAQQAAAAASSQAAAAPAAGAAVSTPAAPAAAAAATSTQPVAAAKKAAAKTTKAAAKKTVVAKAAAAATPVAAKPAAAATSEAAKQAAASKADAAAEKIKAQATAAAAASAQKAAGAQ